MRYFDIAPMCRPVGPFVRGCPHDGLGCTGGKRCSINSEDGRVSTRAYNADRYGPDFICAKRLDARTKAANQSTEAKQ